MTQIQYILVQYSDPICKLFYNFINLLLIYTHFNGNYQIKTKKILNACKNETSHANMQIRKKLGISVGPLIYDNVTKRKMTSAKSDYNILFIKGGWLVDKSNRRLTFVNQENREGRVWIPHDYKSQKFHWSFIFDLFWFLSEELQDSWVQKSSKYFITIEGSCP